MSAADLTTLTNGVKTQLQSLNTTYLQSISENVFGGGANNMDILSDDAAFNIIKNESNVTISLFDNVNNTYGTPMSVYSALGALAINKNISEINCLSLLDNSAVNKTVKEYMSGLYTLYAILNPSYFDNFILSIKENQPFISPLLIPTLNTTTANTVNNKIVMVDVSQNIGTYLGYISTELLTKIYNIPDFNAFIARRIVYLWILMYNFKIAMYYYTEKKDSDSENLALACLEILQKNNGNYNYNSELDKTVQSSVNSQVYLLFNQMWKIIIQLLVPSSKGSFINLDLGELIINNAANGQPFKCTGVSINAIISELPSICSNLRANYPSMPESSEKDYVSAFTDLLKNITQNIPCGEDLTSILSSNALATKNSTKSKMDAAEAEQTTALAQLRVAQTAIDTAKNNAESASKTAISTNTDYQRVTGQIATIDTLLTSANAKLDKDTKGIVVVPAYKNLTTPDTEISIGSTNTPIPMYRPPQNYDLTGSALTYTFSVDIKLTQYPKSWFNIFQNGTDKGGEADTGRYPSMWLNGSDLGVPGRIHYIHDTKNPYNLNIFGNTQLQLNTWNTITVVVSNNKITAYINGVFEASVTANASNGGITWGPNNKILNRWNWVGSQWTTITQGVVVKNANWWTTELSSDVVKRYYNKSRNIVDDVITNNNKLITDYNTEKAKLQDELKTKQYKEKYDAAVLALKNANDVVTTRTTDLNTKYATYIQKSQNYASLKSLYTSAEKLVTELNGVVSETSIELKTLKDLTTYFYSLTSVYENIPTIPQINLTDDPLYSLKVSIINNITKYRNNQSEINTLAPILNKNKETLKNTQTQFKSRKDKDYKLNLYKYIELSIMILITIFAFVIISIPFEKSMKSILTSILSLVAIANILIIYYIFDRPGLIEKFVDISSQNNSDITTAQHKFMDASIQYLIQTDNLNILLQSNMVYGNVNSGLSKEITYYNGVSTELSNRNINVESVYKSSYMTQVNYSAAMQLFMSLSLIVTGFTISYVTLESLEITGAVYSWVSGITAFFIIIVTIIYMLEVSIRVRTNPQQIYWGNPKNRIE